MIVMSINERSSWNLLEGREKKKKEMKAKWVAKNYDACAR